MSTGSFRGSSRRGRTQFTRSSRSLCRRHPVAALLSGAALSGAALLVFAAGPLMAQQTTPADPAVPGVDRPTSVTPWSGPPGTEVTVRGELLPAITPVHVALGGTRTGFEALSLALTTRWGELEEMVAIPDWARNDRAHRFIIFDAYFSPLATSALFHVTGPDGTILRIGRVAEVHEGCVALDGDDDQRYSLTGALEGISVGDRLELEAVILEETPCAGGVPVRVTDFQRFSPAPRP